MFSQNEHVIDRIDALLNGLLPPGEVASVEAHCVECPICEVALREGRRRNEALRTLPQLNASEDLIQRTEAKLDQVCAGDAVRAKSWLRRFTFAQHAAMLAAAVAVMIGTAHLYYLSMSPSPVDLKVLGQNQLLAGTRSSLRVVLMNPNTSLAMAGIPVTVELINAATSEAVRLAGFSTDASGTGRPTIQLPDWPDGDYELRVTADVSGADEIVTRSITLKRSWQLMVSTDKPVYQPGQTILVRSLGLRRPDLKPVVGQTVEFSITDPKGNILQRTRDVSSRFGIASIECPLAQEIIHGDYRIACQIGDTESLVTVEVNDYVLPKFGAVVTLDQPFYLPGAVVHGHVQCDYFFGKPVADGTVEVRVETANIGSQLIEVVSTKTDARGRAEFSCRLPEKLFGTAATMGDAAVHFHVNITDPAGQEYSKDVARLVTNRPLRIEVIPESSLVAEIINRVYLLATYADGRPAKARVVISGFNREFLTSDSGTTVVKFIPQVGMKWNIKATDDAGLTVHDELELSVGRSTGDFLIRLPKAVYQAGTAMEIEVHGSGMEPVFIDLIKDGQTVLTDSISLKAGRGKYTVDLPPELSGTLELVAYRYQSAMALPVRRSRVIYVRPSSDLKIITSLDQNEYRPGDTARLRVQVTDSDGRPAPGAVSLAAVDEAVYNVQTSRPGMERTFFTLQNELLKPVFAIYPWSPELPSASVEDALDRSTLEQALFAKASQYRTVDREKVLRDLTPFLDGDERILEVLNRPDWDTLVPEDFLPEGMWQLLKNEGGKHTLNISTYPEKQRQTEATRREGLNAVRGLWKVFFGFAAIVFVAWMMSRVLTMTWLEASAVLTVCMILIALILPAMQSAREAARRKEATNSVRQIGMALYEMQNANGTGLAPVAEESLAAAARIREWFPETLLWRPEIITDEHGVATVEIPLADSITTWRLNTSAVTATGRLGAGESGIRVFQPYFVDLNLPVSLTRGDEISVPVVVYNYLQQPQTVQISLKTEDWFETLGDTSVSLEVAPGDVRSTSIRIRALNAGEQQLQVTAMGNGVADAIRRQVEVVPDGERVDEVISKTLQRAEIIPFTVPDDAIPGSARMTVQLYPSGFSQVVEGLDAIFRRPNGCFEQTSSSTYPNVLALNYLRLNNKSVPEVEAKARQYIHLGYQRLLGFEVTGGGFDWFGDPPAIRTLTAYGLMEFEDMAMVHDVDPSLIRRTREWLLKQRRSDGSWAPENHQLHDDPTQNAGENRELMTTAYIAWTVFRNANSREEAIGTRAFLLRHAPDSIASAYTLALVSNALLAIDPHSEAATPYLHRLIRMKHANTDGKLAWWTQESVRGSVFHGAGRSGDIETTATACLALLTARRDLKTVRGCLAWLAEQKDQFGTWHSTQATVLALKALLDGTDITLEADKPREVRILVDDALVKTVTITPEDSDVMQQVDLTAHATTGTHAIKLVQIGDTPLEFQTTFRYHIPRPAIVSEDAPFSIVVTYDRTQLQVNDSVTATATLTNNRPVAAPMVVADLPIPPGFTVNADDLRNLQRNGTIAKSQVNARSVVVYLRGLEASDSLALRYRLTATMPVKLTVPGATVYEYYNEDNRARSGTTALTVDESR